MGMIRLGLRNVPRNKARLMLIAFLIGIPVFLLLSLRSVDEAVERQTTVLTRDVNTVLQLRAKGSMGHVNMIGQDRLLPADVPEKVARIENVVQVESYLLAMAPITPPNFVMHVGLAPSAVKRLESHGEAGNPRIIAGRDLTPEDAGQDVAIIGKGYAAWAAIEPKDVGKATLAIDPSRTHPAIYGMNRPQRNLRIVGIYASGYVFGDLQLFVPIDTFRSIYGTDRRVSWVFVRVDSVDNVATVAQRLHDTVGGVADILVPKQAAVFTATTSRTVLRLTFLGGLLAIVLMIIVVFFVVLMQVRERAREIGTLKAIGASNGGVVVQFLTEAVALALLGGAFGLVVFRFLGDAVTRHLFALGIGPFLPSHYRPLFASLSVGSEISASVLLIVMSVAVVAAIIGSSYGVWQLIKISPLEAVKHE
ncbi:MAG: ABC transporter permease [Proteobacteria bacterium]|nr:ABC transporter permease [Pseudomonadota bacterium]